MIHNWPVNAFHVNMAESWTLWCRMSFLLFLSPYSQQIWLYTFDCIFTIVFTWFPALSWENVDWKTQQPMFGQSHLKPLTHYETWCCVTHVSSGIFRMSSLNISRRSSLHLWCRRMEPSLLGVIICRSVVILNCETIKDVPYVHFVVYVHLQI